MSAGSHEVDCASAPTATGMEAAPVTVSAEAAVLALRDDLCATLPVTTALASPTAPGVHGGPDGSGADIHLIHGGQGWSRRAAGPGVRIVIDPVHEPAADLEALAATGATIVLSEPYADNPALHVTGGVAAGHAVYVVDAVDAARPGLRAEDQLLRQLRVLRAVGASEVSVTVATRHRHGITWSGTAAGQGNERAQLCGVAGTSAVGPTRLGVHALSTEQSVQIMLPSDATAAPATVVTTTDDGSLMLPTIYETAHRGVLRRAAVGVREQRRVEGDRAGTGVTIPTATSSSSSAAAAEGGTSNEVSGQVPRDLDSFIRDAAAVTAALDA